MFQPDQVRITARLLDEEGHDVELPLENLRGLLPSSRNRRRVYTVATPEGEVFVEAPNRLVSGDGFRDAASAERAVRIAADMLCLFDPFTSEPVALEDRVLFQSPEEMLGVEYLSPGKGRAALSSMEKKCAARDQSGEIVVAGVLAGEIAWVSSRGVHVARTGQHDPVSVALSLHGVISF
jgi:hypothetical protein